MDPAHLISFVIEFEIMEHEASNFVLLSEGCFGSMLGIVVQISLREVW